MRWFPLLLALSCTSTTSDPPAEDTETGDTEVVDDTVDDTDPVGDTDPPPPDTAEPLSDFEAGTFRVNALRILPVGEGIDLDGNGTIDNALPGLLPLVDAALPADMTIDDVNNRLDLQLSLDNLHILVDANHDVDLVVDLLDGTRDEAGNLASTPESYDEQGVPNQRLVGAFFSGDRMRVGPAEIQVPMAFESDGPILAISAQQAYLRGTLTDSGVGAFIAAAFTVESAMNEIVIPLVQDGLPESEWATTTAVARGLLDLAADVTVDGEPAISATLRIEAVPETWTHAQ
jgi:hypothetical protein